MSLYFYEPSYHFDRVFDRLFDSAFPQPAIDNQSSAQTGGASNAVSRPVKPRMDLHENTETNTVTATFELPGLKKEDVDINVHDGRLTVSGESKISSERNEDGYAIRERRYGSFARALQLPRGVKEEEIKASMENGVLTVTFPKSTKEAEPKKISIA
ncbi:HSP20-like chaperone [Lentinula raphanica]|uniref:HSP20-like chaperone n=1 Tax=Lentinula raphanica TaxID=153919 RepID=A0AA38UDY3_9AGAR|nr:small heat shock protein [Lentinula raphanica]KAJ3757887.1 HSP20-like chaperone [Lentinula raphanica]KAJ3819364.1 HSP20-like chaperone [Lentinula raphanica]KAJ3834542.1 HSP20-like chaperone [Lentinula raphanica]